MSSELALYEVVHMGSDWWFYRPHRWTETRRYLCGPYGTENAARIAATEARSADKGS